jgi:hypothetical protein
MTLGRTAGAAFAVVALAALPLVGCGGSNPVSTGPFGNGGDQASRLCGHLKLGGVFTAGSIAAFSNSGPNAVIDKVRLTHVHGLELLAGYAVPITGNDGYGNLTGYPPEDLSPGVRWAQRQRADGAHIPHSHGSAYVDLVLVFKLVQTSGSIDGVSVYYHNRAGHYYLNLRNGLTLFAKGADKKCSS